MMDHDYPSTRRWKHLFVLMANRTGFWRFSPKTGPPVPFAFRRMCSCPRPRISRNSPSVEKGTETRRIRYSKRTGKKRIAKQFRAARWTTKNQRKENVPERKTKTYISNDTGETDSCSRSPSDGSVVPSGGPSGPSFGPSRKAPWRSCSKKSTRTAAEVFPKKNSRNTRGR